MAQSPATPSFREALRWWFKLGCISFGGPAGQIATMHAELVERRRWISEPRFLHALNYCMLLPGPEAQQLATYIGWQLHGLRGGIAAGVLFVLPSLLLLIALSWVYVAAGDAPWMAAVLRGVKPAVLAIVVAAAWRIGGRTLRGVVPWAIAIGAFLALRWAQLPFPVVIAAAALIGVVVGHARPRLLALPASAVEAASAHAPNLARARAGTGAGAGGRRAMRLSLAFLGLWAAAFGLLAISVGTGSTFAQLAWFHTKAALLTFGGAYAVLPYVFQSAVMQYGWLSAAQMVDGLALGETTPGPLIMIVAFVGFVAGWQQPPQDWPPQLSAVVGALVATLFTFLPSFLFVLAGAPLIEATGRMPRVQAPLAAVTAAVVGVIVSLAAWFAGEVLWRPGIGIDWVGLAIAAAALAALTVLRRNVVEVILLSAFAGVASGAWS